ncbi:MAG: enoyl-CoA hydratase/isomerase family protein [Pseudomonadales bacterium]|jgi:3-hydroxyacyl-CoA dehydrogenase/enoyl-CoA hydratase/3-hydroxybutyryl-CoA epimerase|nr:enoyl-CoA hydratase/isomerase family protein [Pseudomonadales bacterium]
MSYIKLKKDADGIVEFIFDQPNEKVNKMGDAYIAAMGKAVADLVKMKDSIKGVYVRSGKDTFFGGGDLNMLLDMPTKMDEKEATFKFNGIMDAKKPLRILETLGVPVVVGINGAALGGGYEIALACHHRIAIDRADVKMGLPEAQLGLMPGAGGVVRMVRKFGCQNAITFISQGMQYAGAKALEKGFCDELATDEKDMHAKAKAWILANAGAKQPWDQPGFKIPGGSPADKDPDQGLVGLLYFGPVNVMNSTKGNFPAPKAIFACVHDVARVDFDTAEKIEARYFLSLMTSQVAKNMIRTFFFQLQALEKGASRPKGVKPTSVKKLGILGAGMMGAGLAYLAAQKGVEVVLKDINMENAEKGKAYSEKVGGKDKKMTPEKLAKILSLIKPTDKAEDLAGCDFVIEAVFENRAIKAVVTKEAEAVINKDAVFASNTSALPITELAEASKRPANFIGMHFFSPAEKMPLVEIICGKKTSKETLAKAFDLGILLGKKPIVVNDAPGFFTTRVIGSTITEGAQMVLEGINPVLIDSAAAFNGSPVGPLNALDEISLETAYKNGKQGHEDAKARGEKITDNATFKLVEEMVTKFDRKGKAYGGGFYDYPEGGKKVIWPGLKTHYAKKGYKEIPFEDIKDRLVFCQVIEAVKAMEEGVIESVADGNIGSIMGIGFPPHVGGVYQCINHWGVKEFTKRAQDLAKKYGKRFEPPKLLKDKAKKNEQFV